MSQRIVSDPAILGGTVVFRGTRIPFGHVVGLMRAGVAGAEIEEDYPALSAHDIAFARTFTRLIPACASAEDLAQRSIRRHRKVRIA
ncbi:MAG TPA: DUF433 domain-containing protein [Terracidiphilus sp.]